MQPAPQHEALLPLVVEHAAAAAATATHAAAEVEPAGDVVPVGHMVHVVPALGLYKLHGRESGREVWCVVKERNLGKFGSRCTHPMGHETASSRAAVAAAVAANMASRAARMACRRRNGKAAGVGA